MNNIIVALDGMELSQAEKIASQLKGRVWGFKLNDLIVQYGAQAIFNIANFGKVMADCKLHDIPKTVSNSIAHLRNYGVDIITVHASGGVEMMQAAKEAADHIKIFAVTLLTSLSEDEILSFYNTPKFTLVKAALMAGVDGVVCSGEMIPLIPKPLLTCVPGIRPSGLLEDDDQKRIFKSVNADFLVVGRPITRAENPLKALEEIKLNIECKS